MVDLPAFGEESPDRSQVPLHLSQGAVAQLDVRGEGDRTGADAPEVDGMEPSGLEGLVKARGQGSAVDTLGGPFTEGPEALPHEPACAHHDSEADDE